MGWGTPFISAWSMAREPARYIATEAAQTAKSAYAYVSEKATDAYEYTKRKAIEGYNYAKDEALAAYDKAKNDARNEQTTFLNKALNGVTTASDVLEGAWNLTPHKKLYDLARSMFPATPASSPSQPCPYSILNSAYNDSSRDGWIFSPQAGEDCKAFPPGDTAVANARKEAFKSDSACCRQKAAAGQASRDIIYVNGVQNNSKDHCETLTAIAEQTCGRVIGVYNATAGKVTGFIADGVQTGNDRKLITAAAAGKKVPTHDGRNPAVDSLSRIISQEVSSGNPPEIWAHSQGGAVTSLALYQARNEVGVESPEPLRGVKVKSFGSAAPMWPGGPDYDHYVHMEDPVPTSFGLGDDPADDIQKTGGTDRVTRFSGDPKSTARFKVVDRQKGWFPGNPISFATIHPVAKSYLKMEKEKNGGCPE